MIHICSCYYPTQFFLTDIKKGPISFFLFKYLSIWLHQVFVAACVIFMLHCVMQDL